MNIESVAWYILIGDKCKIPAFSICLYEFTGGRFRPHVWKHVAALCQVHAAKIRERQMLAQVSLDKLCCRSTKI